MTGKERVKAALCGMVPDRTPVLASTLAGAAWMQGVAQKKFHTDSETLADCVVKTCRNLRLDGIYVSSDNWIMHEALGGKVKFLEDDEPWGSEPLMANWADLSRLSIPDPQKSGRMPMMLDAARRVVESAGHDLYIEANIDSGPFQLALTLRGAEDGMMELMDAPARFHELLEFTTEVAIEYGKAMVRTGVDGIQFGESSASLVNAEIFEEFVLPYNRRVITSLKESGVDSFLHICGRSGHLLKGMAKSGADCLEVDALVTLEDVFDAVKSSICVRGNVDTTLLYNGPTDAIKAAARACIEQARLVGGRLILSPGCGVPKMTPASHVLALVETSEEER